MDEVQNRVVSRTQEQAVASWVDYLNRCRFEELLDRLSKQDANLRNALNELAELKSFIGDPSHILGNPLTKHGEIAEHVQVNISNARAAIEGLPREYIIDPAVVPRTDRVDYMKGIQAVQSKFHNSLSNTVLNGIQTHLEKYSDFVEKGGYYDIPKDQYDEMIRILTAFRDKDSRSLMSKHDYDLSVKIDAFLKEKGLDPEKDIMPSIADYKQVQTNVVGKSVSAEERSIKERDNARRLEAAEETAPSWGEGIKVTGVSAAIEGGVAFCIAFAEKRKEKTLSDFSAEDWKEIGIDTGTGLLKGGVRGGSIYLLTNFINTPANIASAYVTAAFGIVNQIRLFENGEITQEDFVINAETVCLDASISAVASLLGQTLIPVPVLGAVIGNVAGELIYEVCKKQGAQYEADIIANYNTKMHELDQLLDAQLQQVILQIKAMMQRFRDLEELAFDENSNKAFCESVELARELGVEENRILHDLNETDDFFMA